MPNVQIRQLYNYERFPEASVNILTLVLYFPFGFVIFLLRSVFIILPIYITSFILNDVPLIEQLFRRLLYVGLGIGTKVDKPEKFARGAIYISNCVSPLDHLVLVSLAGCQSAEKKKLRPLLAKALGLHGPPINPSNLENAKKEINDYLSYEQKGSLLLQPEGKMTNGKALLKFKTWPFEICTKVYPVIIKVHRPILDIAVSTISSSIWSDIFFYMFSLKTIYDVKFLPPIEKNTMSNEEFAEEVRRQMASSLKIESVDYTANDLEEWEKRYLADLERNTAVRQGSSTSSGLSGTSPPLLLQTMARQVKDVLPLVPLNVIYRDLAKTRNVDLTVANILDGHVPYIPETLPAPNTQNSGSISSPSTSSVSKESGFVSQSTTPTEFGRSATERMKSFQERKRQLIESARKKYIERNGLVGEKSG